MTQREDVPALLIRALSLGQPVAAADAAALRTLTSRSAADLISREGAASWLHRRLRSANDGNAADTGDASTGDSFAAQVRAAAMRDAATSLRVESAALEALDVLRSAAVDVVLLKGIAYRAAAKSYPYAAERATIDVDLLVEPPAASHAWQALRVAGFEPTPTPPVPAPANHHHLPGLWSAERVSIELHTSTSAARRSEDVWRRMRGSAEEREWNGARVLVPCATELLWHAVEHSCTHGATGFTLKQLLPGAAALGVADAVDSEEIERRALNERLFETESTRAVGAAAVHRWLALASALGGMQRPPAAWRGGESLLWRLLTWRLGVIEHLSAQSRLYPHLWEQGTRAELSLASAYDTPHASLRYRMQHRALATIARMSHAVLRSRPS